MNLRSYTLGFVPVAAMLASFGLDASAIAQTSYEFSVTYDTVVTIDPSFMPDLGISRATITGESTDASYGLTNFTSNTYSRFDPTTNTSTFNADPAVFGLEGEPVLSDRYYGGSNELFGTASDMATFDFEEGTVSGAGTITITGGEGIFENATGKITFTQNDRLTSTDLTEPFRGQAKLNFSVEAVPEPSSALGVLAVGALGVGSWLQRKRKAHTKPLN